MQENPGQKFIRRSFYVSHIIHWALMVLAVPVIALIPSKTVFVVYYIVAFFTIIIALVTTMALEARSSWSAQTASRLTKTVHITMVLLIIFFLFGMLLFSYKKGGPEYWHGIYCIWNHGFVREISKQEYEILTIIQRGWFCSILAIFRSALVLPCCQADGLCPYYDS